MHHVITQYYLRGGLNKFRKKVITEVLNKFQKIHNPKAFVFMNMTDLITEKKDKILESQMYLK